MNGKGDKTRPTDWAKFREHHDAIFGKKPKESKPDKLTRKPK